MNFLVHSLVFASVSAELPRDPMFQATMVRLGFHDRPLLDHVNALNEEHDFGLFLRLKPAERDENRIFVDPGDPRRFAKLCERRVTLKTDEPLPFWKAMDLLCNTADLCYGLAERTALGNSQASYDLFAAPTKRGAVVDSGPFRIQVSDWLVTPRWQDGFGFQPWDH